MNGGTQQFARVLESLQPITVRPIMPESDETIRNCSDEEWENIMRAKYPEEYQDGN